MKPTKLQAQILAALAAEPLTTMQLADAIQATPSVRAAGIRHTLRRMVAAGMVEVHERRRRQGSAVVVWRVATPC